MLKNYYPECPLPTFAKVFENIIFMLVFEYFIENEPSTVCHYGFLESFLHFTTLKYIHETLKSFDESPLIDVRDVKVW